MSQVSDRGPVHLSAEVLSVKKVGGYRHLTLIAPGVAERYRPGNFVAVSVGGETGSRLGRRCFWIHRVRATGAYGATVEVVIDPVGPGTRWLTDRSPGDRLDLTGPLGRPFALPKEPVSCVLVGEGYGGAPLFGLAERLRERGSTVTMLLAATDEAHLFAALEARRAARAVTVVTVDGSVGQRGRVADVLNEVLSRAAADVVYGCGPNATLHAVAAAAEHHGAWSQTAIAGEFFCGTGLCQGCTLPVVGEDGVTRMVRGCVEGPVLRGDRVRWADLGDGAARSSR